MRWVAWFGIAGGIALSSGCGGKSVTTAPATLTPGGMGGSGGGAASSSGGASGGNGGTVTVLAGTSGTGAVAGREVHPPSTVDLETCAHVSDENADSNSDCFFCCADAGFANMSYFGGRCACSNPAESTGADACTSEPSLRACSACCLARGFQSMLFDRDTPCECLFHMSSSICPAASSDPEPSTACAICCVNAGYIGSGLNGPCICSQG
jgi:hypothetical protein